MSLTRLLTTMLAAAAVTGTTLAIAASAGDGVRLTSAATTAHENGRIAFVRNGYGISTMEPDGSDQKALQTVDAPGLEPSWSPDSSLIAYRTSFSSKSSLWLMNADGSGALRLIDGKEPDWSPDGGRIVLSRQHAPGDKRLDIWVIDADGSNPVQLTNSGATDRSPAWSADGTRIAFVSNRDGNLEVYSMAADGSDQRNLSGNPMPDAQPAWSADGGTIAFARGGLDQLSIWLMASDGSSQRRFSADPEREAYPSFSPDGTRLAYVRRLPNPEFGTPVDHVFSAALDGSDKRDLSGDTLSPGANGEIDWGVRPPVPPPPPPPAAGSLPTDTTPSEAKKLLSLSSRSLTPDRSGNVAIRASCPRGRVTCAGLLTLTVALRTTCRRVRLPAGRRAGRGNYVVPPGRTSRVRIRLSSSARRVLACGRSVRVRASAVAIDSVGGRVSTTLQVRQRRARTTQTVAAARANPDPAFGHSGRVVLSWPDPADASDYAGDIAVAPDGSIYVADMAGWHVGVFKLHPDGALDASFGDGGHALAGSLGAQTGQAPSLELQPDGKVLVTGFSDSPTGRRFAVARLDPSGRLDPAFDGDGVATIDVAPQLGDDSAQDLALAPDGSLVIAGTTPAPVTGAGTDFAVVRLNPDGLPDGDFGVDGRVILPMDPDTVADSLFSVRVDPTGHVVAAGSSLLPGAGFELVVVRLNENGVPDPTFDGDGRSVVSFGGDLSIEGLGQHGLALLDGSRSFIGGFSLAAGTYRASFAAALLDSAGALDPSFAGAGRLLVPIGASNSLGQAALVAGGRMYVAGDIEIDGQDSDAALLALHSDGTPDEAFAPGGVLPIPFYRGRGRELAVALAELPDRRIAVLSRVPATDGGDVGVTVVAPEGVTTPPPPLPPPPAPTPPTSSPDSNIDPIPARIRSRKLRAFSGTASANRLPVRVEIALVKLPRGVRPASRAVCMNLLDAKGRFGKRAARARCHPYRWLRAAGSAAWRFGLKRRLPAGRYTLYSRAIDATGVVERRFIERDHNRAQFTVVR